MVVPTSEGHLQVDVEGFCVDMGHHDDIMGLC